MLTWQNRRTRRETCASATLSTTNTICTDLGANPGVRGERRATNSLIHGTTLVVCLSTLSVAKIMWHRTIELLINWKGCVRNGSWPN
jgi:hypothetical protein